MSEYYLEVERCKYPYIILLLYSYEISGIASLVFPATPSGVIEDNNFRVKISVQQKIMCHFELIFLHT